MSIGLAYWIILLIWFVFGIASHINPTTFGGYGFIGHAVIVFILFALIGWQVFGSALHK